MKGDKKVIEYLNKGLKHELTAINQYFLHSKMLEDWGVSALAKHEYKESIEEMAHAEKFIDRILLLEGFPNLQDLDKIRIGEDVKEILECDLAAEYSARTLYQEAASHCEEVKDYASRDLFVATLKDEEEHIDHIETQLGLIKQIGIQNFIQTQAGPAES